MSGSYACLLLLLLLLLFSSSVHSQSTFERGERIPLLYNKIFSHRTLLPYSYASLPFICPPYTEEDWSHKSRMSSWLAVDQDWFGDYPILSDYKVAALEDVDCHVLCTRMWSVDDAKKAKDLILDDYQVDWWLDGLPGATASYTNEVDTRAYRVGFPLGQVKKNDQTFINNHVTFNLLYTPSSKDSNRIQIVGFEVYPDSVANGHCTHTSIDYAMQEVVEEPRSITFTYSVRWKEAKQPQPETRWNMYIIPPQPEAHFYSIINSIITCLILCLVVAVILLKTSKREHDETEFKIHDDFEDVIGWRLIHRDVFRRPIYGGLLAPIIGSGVQLLITVLVTFASVLTGHSHPARVKDLLVFSACVFTLASLVGGYYSARIYKVFRGKSWTLNAILTSTLIPSIICTTIVVQNIFLWWKKSSLTISFRGCLTLSLLYLFALVPLTFIGAFIGEQRERIEHPVRPTQMPRYIPSKRWYQRYAVSVGLGGVIPFAVIFVDLDELLQTMWQNDLYLSISYASMACLTYAISVSAITVALIFFQLCSEDYHWWWMSFGIGGSSSLYIFTYAMFCYWTKFEIHGLVGGLVYTMHTLLGCTLLGLCTGALGFLSAYAVVKKIYAAVKVD